jgi:hypothetical protein
MAILDCCDASGGRVIITANGQHWSARSALTIKPTVIERTAGSNQDGSLHVQNKPVPAEADLSLSDRCGMTLDDVMNCPLDVTLDLIDMKRKYLFSRAIVVGRPEINSETGEIRGIKITSATVQIVNY